MRRSLWVMSCLALALSASVTAQQFTYNAAALPAQNIFTDGVELVDVDADDDLDIVFSNRGGSGIGPYGTGNPAAQHLFINDGTGTFSAGHAQLNVANMAAPMVIAEDFDNDGDPDLMYARDSVWPAPTAPPVILINDGTGNFTDETASRIPLGFNMTGFGICAGDTDNDGDLDVVVTNGGTFNGVATQARLLQNDGTGVFTNITATNMPVDTYNAQDVTLLDVDNDFDIDILLSGKGATGKRSRLYLNNGSGVFSINTSFDALGSSGTYEIDYADLDGDSDFDAFIQSNSGFTEGWGQNIGTGGAWPEVNIAGPNQDDNEMGCFDYDNDGDLDLIAGSLGGSERAYNNNGAVFTLTAGVFQAVSDSTMDMAFGDLNGDGKYDFVTAQGEANHVDKVYMNSGTADTLAPVYKLVETPAAIGASETVFRARVQDAISDDGHVNATLTYAWVTTGTGASSGSGDATPQGGGQWRAAVPTNPGTLSVSLTWTATDAAGNSANHGPIVVNAAGDPWTDLGGGLAGVSGIPLLVGTGPLTTGSAGSLALSGAAPSAICSLFISLASTPAPFKCGTLVPVPIAFQFMLFTNGSGNLNLAWPSWPNGLSGASVYFQHAIADGAAICGVSISNAVRGDVP